MVFSVKVRGRQLRGVRRAIARMKNGIGLYKRAARNVNLRRRG